MSKKSGEDVEFWGITDMLNYAKKLYYTGDEPQYFDEYVKELWSKAIRRELKKYRLTNYDKNDENAPEDRTKPILVAKVIAQYIIHDVMSDYFSKSERLSFKKREAKFREKEERKRREVLQELENQSEEHDKEETEKSWDNATYFAPTSYEDEYNDCSYARAQSPEHEEELKEMGFKILSNKAAIPENFLRYKLPRIPLDDMTGEQVDEIVYRTMLRAVFELFFDFKEEQFRTDLFERAARIFDGNSGEQEYDKGYHALTQKLENPMDIYITLKKK